MLRHLAVFFRISADGRVKLTDFGLSVITHNGVYKSKSRNEALPVRSMAPESLSNLTFSFESDMVNM